MEEAPGFARIPTKNKNIEQGLGVLDPWCLPKPESVARGLDPNELRPAIARYAKVGFSPGRRADSSRRGERWRRWSAESRPSVRRRPRHGPCPPAEKRNHRVVARSDANIP